MIALKQLSPYSSVESPAADARNKPMPLERRELYQAWHKCEASLFGDYIIAQDQLIKPVQNLGRITQSIRQRFSKTRNIFEEIKVKSDILPDKYPTEYHPAAGDFCLQPKRKINDG